MTLQEACARWMGDFSPIPTSLIVRAFTNAPEELDLLSSELPEYAWPCAHGWMFHPEHLTDEEWIIENIEAVEACGFLIYDSDETGILLGVDGGGYSFLEEHWLPLYLARGLCWHDECCTVIQ
jgi:hypothetical protein